MLCWGSKTGDSFGSNNMWKCPFPPAPVTLHSPRTSYLYTPKILPKNLSPIPQCLTGSPAFNTFHFLRYTPSPHIAILFQLTIEGGGKLGPTRTHKAKVESNFWEFWLNFCHFGTENPRFGTIPRILLILLTSPKIGTQSAAPPSVETPGT